MNKRFTELVSSRPLDGRYKKDAEFIRQVESYLNEGWHIVSSGLNDNWVSWVHLEHPDFKED